VYPITGRSLLPLLQGGSAAPVHLEPFGDEAYGRAYLFSGDGKWKALWTEPPTGPQDGHWELFDVSRDRGETTDLSAQYPAVHDQLVQQWRDYMTRVGGVEPAKPQGYY
jgi:arylsulfatase